MDETGNHVASSVIHQIEETDTDQFVKVFAAGIAAAYDLSRTGQKVFQAILQEYEREPMSGASPKRCIWHGSAMGYQAETSV